MGKIVTTGKARQLYELLRQDILDGAYADGSRLPSIRALAAQYGLSSNTVSTAIAMLVSEGLAAVQEGNGTYVTRNPRKSRMIGVMMFNFSRSMQVDTMILEHIQKNLPGNYYLSLVNTSNRYDVFCEGLEHSIDAGAAGLLIVPPKDDPKNISDIQRVRTLLSQVPTVFLNRSIPGIEMDTYSMDLKKGIASALSYLTAIGRTKTVLILHDSDKFIQEETCAYSRHMHSHGLPFDPKLLIDWSPDIARIAQKIQQLDGQYDSMIAPDGILVQLTDVIAQSGLSVPEDLSLIGINDTVLSRLHNPPLSALAYPVERIGKHAVQQLIRRIEGTETSPAGFYNYPPELIIRKS